MATNPPAGDGHRKGAVRKRSQVKNPKTKRYVKRDTTTGQFIDQKADDKPFKGVRKESRPAATIPYDAAALAGLFASDPVPMAFDTDGVCRIGRTRVTLDTVVATFDEGATAEEIASQYPSLVLEDIYAVISHVLRHRPDVDQYLNSRQAEAARVQAENESKIPPKGLRDQLTRRAHVEPARTFADSDRLRVAFDELRPPNHPRTRAQATGPRLSYHAAPPTPAVP